MYQLENSFFNSLSVFSVFGTVGGKLAIKYRKENNIVFFSYIMGFVYLDKYVSDLCSLQVQA